MADERDPGRVARDAALQSLVSNVVYLALMVGVTVAISKRDWLARQRLRMAAGWRQDGRRAAERKAMADFRREVSQIEHWLNRGADSRPADPPAQQGGLYGPG